MLMAQPLQQQQHHSIVLGIDLKTWSGHGQNGPRTVDTIHDAACMLVSLVEHPVRILVCHICLHMLCG